MAKLSFKYATMNSGKSIDLIRTAYNYEENGYNVLVMKPKIDTKAGNKISSRVGLEREVDILLEENSLVLDILKDKLDDINCILVDEAQFLKKNQVDDLYLITKAFNIPVLCYGLRTNFKMESFEGSKRLLEVCEELEEISTLCGCGELARFVGRSVDGYFTSTGEEVLIDGTLNNVEYVPLCGECYLQKVKKIDLKRIKENL